MSCPTSPRLRVACMRMGDDAHRVERPAAPLREALLCPLCQVRTRLFPKEGAVRSLTVRARRMCCALRTPRRTACTPVSFPAGWVRRALTLLLAPDCRACVDATLDADNPTCPVCHGKLGRDPYESGALRFDRSKTSICSRLFPRPDDAQLLVEEEERADAARRKREAEAPAGPRRAAGREERRPRGRHYGVPEEAYPPGMPQPRPPSVESAVVVYQLRPLEPAACPAGCAAPELEKPFLRTPPDLTVSLLSRYVLSRLPPEAASGRQVLMCALGQPVEGEVLLQALLEGGRASPAGGSEVPAIQYRFAQPAGA